MIRSKGASPLAFPSATLGSSLLGGRPRGAPGALDTLRALLVLLVSYTTLARSSLRAPSTR